MSVPRATKAVVKAVEKQGEADVEAAIGEVALPLSVVPQGRLADPANGRLNRWSGRHMRRNCAARSSML
jgi:hypothetical protein